MNRFLLVIIGTLAAFVVSGSVATAQGGRFSYAVLTGSNEPNGGDPDGIGFAFIRVNENQREVCWRVIYTRIATATAAHIHVGPAGVNGPVVLPLSPIAAGCATASPELINALLTQTDQYYVNVHTADFPGGAIRGQLVGVGIPSVSPMAPVPRIIQSPFTPQMPVLPRFPGY